MMAALHGRVLRGRMRRGERLSRHTTWRVGGTAACFYEAADLEDLQVFLQQIDADEPLLWLGLGSNVLVRDGGFPGTVISTSGALSVLAFQGEGIVRAEAGVPSAKVAKFCANHGLGGVEFLAGIPGTMGGALAMNAGAFGSEVWRWVHAVETIDHDGQIRVRAPADFEVGYRSVRGPEGEWFVAAHLTPAPGERESCLALIKTMLAKRNTSQPTGWASCGSVFRNPENDYAGRLIEQAGLKGACMGGACVSDKHANFIVNTGHATAHEIESLILHVQQTVKQHHGVLLQPEVRIVGVNKA